MRLLHRRGSERLSRLSITRSWEGMSWGTGLLSIACKNFGAASWERGPFPRSRADQIALPKWKSDEVREEAQILIFVFVIVLAAATHSVSARTTEVRRINVYVTCDGSDIVGGHLCFAVKEEIITATGFQLVDAMTAKTGIGLHLVSVDASPAPLRKGLSSAVSVTFTFFGGPIEYYDGAQVFLVGSKKIDGIASAIISAVERRATKLRG